MCLFFLPLTQQRPPFSQKSSTEINENQEINFSVYPNPANNLLTVTKDNSVEYCNIFIYDILGKKVKERMESSDDAVEMNVSDLENGIYFLQIENAKGILRKEKIMITH